MKRLILASICLVCASLTVAACASDSQDRSPWHQYLHDHKME